MLSENKIHSDEGARALGYRAGFVPGITTFGYMSRPVIEAFGLSFLDRGRASIKLMKPVFDGDALEIAGTVAAVDAESARIDLVVSGAGEIKAKGSATLLERALPPIDLSAWPKKPMPASPRAPTREALAADSALGTLEIPIDTAAHLTEIDDAPLSYREASVAHPALLLGAANWVLAANVALGAWIHLASEIELRGRARHEDVISVRAKIDRLFERNGRDAVDLDVLVVVNDIDPVMRVKHTAIYRL